LPRIWNVGISFVDDWGAVVWIVGIVDQVWTNSPTAQGARWAVHLRVDAVDAYGRTGGGPGRLERTAAAASDGGLIGTCARGNDWIASIFAEPLKAGRFMAEQSSEADPKQQAAARVGSVVAAKWHLDALLGIGGMATVYAATHRNQSRAALKILHVEFAREPEIRERFLKEARIANRVDHIARVPVIDDDVTEQGEPFLVMELLEGDPFDKVLKSSGGKLSVEQTFRVFDTVLDLLAACHRLDIIHRDIKPANIFVTRSGEVRVMDFGVARMRESQVAGATRQGTALGTPAYMAPEQALGVGEMVDARADLYSVGACIYRSLTGKPLRKGRNDNEAFVLAATQPAPSIARLAPELPVEVVAFVDKSLAHDRARRFQDAAAMRAEMLALLSGIRSGRVRSQQARKARGVMVRASDDVVDDSEARTSPEDKAKRVEFLQEFWKQTGMYMSAVRQYGRSHPNSTRALENGFDSLVAALTFDPHGVSWDLTPFAFTVEGTSVWEPDRAPFDRIPYQLFASGFRKMQVTRGVTMVEYGDFLALIGRDEAAIGGEDDAVSAFWDRRFEHFQYFAVDSFAEGDAQEREDFERQCATVAQKAVAVANIDKAWESDSVEAQALMENVTSALREAGESAMDLAIEAPIRATLGAQLADPTDRWNDRFVDAFAHGYVDAAGRGDLRLLSEVLEEWSRDQITLRSLVPIFEMFDGLCRSMGTRVSPSLRQLTNARIANIMFGPERLRAILQQLSQEGLARDHAAEPASLPSAVVEGLGVVLSMCESNAVIAAACECYQNVRSEPLRKMLFEYLSRWAAGNETDLARILAGAEPDLALAILRVMAKSASTQALVVFEMALNSPHADVRLESITTMPATQPERVAPQVERVTADSDPRVRREALRLLVKFGATGAVPSITRRIQAPNFHDLQVTERREWMSTLWKLAQPRAEEVLIAIVSEKKLIPSEAAELTRAVAADMLGAASSEEALKAARFAAKKWWWNTPDVREAAARSVRSIEQRRGQAPGPQDQEPPSRRGNEP
jgi:eukaryotic-like serine/threonine-protein kinase